MPRTSQRAAVEGMAQPPSAQNHYLLPRLAETLQTATSPGRASLGVAPDCHVLIRKPGEVCVRPILLLNRSSASKSVSPAGNIIPGEGALGKKQCRETLQLL